MALEHSERFNRFGPTHCRFGGKKPFFFQIPLLKIRPLVGYCYRAGCQILKIFFEYLAAHFFFLKRAVLSPCGWNNWCCIGVSDAKLKSGDGAIVSLTVR